MKDASVSNAEIGGNGGSNAVHTEADSVFGVLTRHGVPFVVIGGHAVNYHGYVRATEDHDVVLLRTPDSEASLFGAC
jgi:hypothetical protein